MFEAVDRLEALAIAIREQQLRESTAKARAAEAEAEQAELLRDFYKQQIADYDARTALPKIGGVQ